MRVHKKIGTKEKLFEMFENVNKIKLNEEIHNTSIDDLKQYDRLEDSEGNQFSIQSFEDGHVNVRGDRGGKFIANNELKYYKKRPSIGKFDTNESFDSPKEKDKKYLDKTVGDESSQVSKYDDGIRYPVEDRLKVKDPSLEKLKGDDAPIKEAFDEDDQDVVDKNSEETQLDVNPDEEPVDNDDGESAEEKPAWDENFGDEPEPDDMEMDTLPPDEAAEDAPELGGEIENGGVEQMTNTMEEPHVDQIEGGLADDAQPSDFCPVQIAKGIQVEMEHTDDPHKALEIAMDHLTEISDYYDRLEAMEAEAKGMETDMGAPEDSLLDPSKHWVDDYTPQNVSMRDEELEEDYPLEGGDPEAGEEEYEFYEKAKNGEFEDDDEKTIDENVDSINGIDINGVPINKYEKYLNNELSNPSSNKFEGGTDVWVFDFPKSKFDENWYNSMKQYMGYSDAGVEGNAGGWVTKERKDIEDVGDYYRLTVTIESVMDI